jgi:hypothetical protein
VLFVGDDVSLDNTQYCKGMREKSEVNGMEACVTDGETCR